MARVAERRDGEVMTDRKTPTWPVITTDHPVCQVVDLRRTFRTQFRYEWDEVFQAESPAGRKQEAAHLTIIPGEFGSVSPHGGPLLVAYCHAGAVKRRQLEDLACVQILHGGGKDCDEVMGLFAPVDMKQVAEVLNLRTPRVYLPEERSRRRVRLARARQMKKRPKSIDTDRLPRGQEPRTPDLVT